MRKLLSTITNGFILLLEDIDNLNIDLRFDKDSDGDTTGNKWGLTGILNAIDGVWSSCRQEMIISYSQLTSYYIDPRLLRPCMMDMKVFMGHCGYEGFKTLAENYLQVKDHDLFPKIESKLTEGVKINPAQVAEVCTRNHDVDSVVKSLVELLEKTEDGVEDGVIYLIISSRIKDKTVLDHEP
ncbi:P-loop containing nucleoside triphosphate hydrolases superfamily protein [Raphanus sativus]|uniref:AAA-ATPase At5g17760-like n=1 Tax=Raphanus sativus TaxID=3726 RepID=A0A6J0MND0_RAPSA|nr:AAA-ATPase At5g17760-like [Raphanus sativus]KAJ4905670.1 P-loop containing nucleoside triphosphate hydrolases superfamily protein [Raphanus sativus]